MIGRVDWRSGSRVLLQTALFIACYLALSVVCQRVAEDTLSAAGNLTLVGIALLVLGASVTIACAIAKSCPAALRATRLALCAAPVGLVLLGGVFIKTSYADVSIQLEALIHANDPPEPDTTIVLGPDGSDVRLSGQLGPGAAARLDALLRQHSSVKRIHLTSEGGLADEGQAIGDVIAAHALTTFVPDYCVSACTLAFVRGTERLLLPNARIGFHAPFEEGLFGVPIEEDSSAQRRDYLAAGVDPGFVTAALAVPAADLWIPDPERLVAARVATGVVDTYRFPDSNLDGAANQAGARAVVLRNFKALAAFEAHAPEIVDRIAAWYYDAYRIGLSEGEVVKGITRAVDLAVSSALRDADDVMLVHFARTISDAMAAAARRAPEECLAIGRNADLVKATHYLGRSGAGGQDAGRSNAGGSNAGGSGPNADRFLDLLVAAMAHPSYAGAVDDTAFDSMLRADSCAQAREAYATVLRGPDREVALFLRRVLTGSGMQVARRSSPITRASLTGAAR